MSWEDFITHVATTTTKVEKVLIYDNVGNPVMTSDGVETNQTEGKALVSCLRDSTVLLVELHIDGDSFCCIQGDDSNMVGRGIRNRSLVIAAVREAGGDHAVAFIGRSAEKGSFIFELQNTLTLRAQGRLLPQLQRQELEQQQRAHVPEDLMSASNIVGGVEQVLVEIA